MKKLPAEEIKKVEQELINKHGPQGDEWQGYCNIFVRGQERYYAFRRPGPMEWEQYQAGLQGIVFNKKQAKSLYQVQRSLIVDCLLFPAREEWLADQKRKPALVEQLAGVITDLATEDDGDDVSLPKKSC